MSRSICINLTAAEAIAWRDGATCLIRPLKNVRHQEVRAGIFDPPIAREIAYSPIPWEVGYVLIGREVYRTFPEVRNFDGTWMAAETEFRADTDRKSGQPWMSPTTMPAALARYRMCVVSVRVCRAHDIEPGEASAAIPTMRFALNPSQYLNEFLEVTGTHPESYVSVTMLEKT